MRTDREMSFIEENRRNAWQGYLMLAGFLIVPVLCGMAVPSSEGGVTVALAVFAGFVAYGVAGHHLYTMPLEERRVQLHNADVREGLCEWRLDIYGKFHVGT
jgi:hypothetical protein